MIAAAVAAGMLLLAAPTGPPPVDRLFACALPPDAAQYLPPRQWKRQPLEGWGLTVAVPPGWELDVTFDRARLRAPKAELVLELRRGRVAKSRQVEAIKRAVEASELGPSHMAPRCAWRAAVALQSVTRLSPIRVANYGRPLGDRRRSYAVYGGLADGSSLTAVVTARWRRRDDGPEMPVVRRLLGAVRVAPQTRKPAE